ncbi:hypothetical protein LTR62_001009 [Meristemomyces frigidus]|uniref:Uncharacterized protein n=1 Tax=Meristemomyces frigidus TaxID=1508187 RepID=A0AAN7YL98_9PEZI|nr:hypothetical protein LTR62_001009 [Meristemomyces frigidus]
MTQARLMCTLLPSRLLRSHDATPGLRLAARTLKSAPPRKPRTCLSDYRCFAHVADINRRERDIWFTSSAPRYSLPDSQGDHKPPDERTLQLGRTVRVLHERLPILLQSPLPGDILSPQITLHLFPSTHPHLPTVSGRIAYNAALWTAPVAWGRIPLVGNVKLTILSERMARDRGIAVASASGDERLIVKWKTCGKTRHRDPTGGVYKDGTVQAKDPMEKIRDFIAGATSPNKQSAAQRLKTEEEQEFCGIFVFEFDEKGRVLKHTIEHTEEGGHWDRTARVVSVTDWLMGRLNGKGREHMPELALCEQRSTGGRMRIVDRSSRFV